MSGTPGAGGGDPIEDDTGPRYTVDPTTWTYKILSQGGWSQAMIARLHPALAELLHLALDRTEGLSPLETSAILTQLERLARARPDLFGSGLTPNLDVRPIEDIPLPRLLLMCGLPRSGKTTVARELERKRNYVRVSPDDIRMAMHGQMYLPEAEKLVWANAMLMARALLLAGRSVVVDACFTTRIGRREWADVGFRLGIDRGTVLVDTPLVVCLARNNGALPEDAITRKADHYEPPTHEDGLVLRPVDGVGFAVLACDCSACEMSRLVERSLRMPTRLYPNNITTKLGESEPS